MLNKLIPIQQIHEDFLAKKGVELYILRLDLIHPYISGNKWFKLQHNLEKARNNNKKTLLTFGGAYSNHIVATAVAGKLLNFKTIGIIRGEEVLPLNKHLQIAVEHGMQLYYVSRELYRDKLKLNDWVKNTFGNDVYVVPEGGANDLGFEGCKDILNFTIEKKEGFLYANYQKVDKYVLDTAPTSPLELTINQPVISSANAMSVSIDGQPVIDFNYICCACGTGTTLAGITASLQTNQKAIGFQVLKAEKYIYQEVGNYLKTDTDNFEVCEDYHFNGYAKTNQELDHFIETFIEKHHIPIEFLYTGKILYGIYDLCKNSYFLRGTKILAIHSGGYLD